MTVSSTASTIQYACDGVSTGYSFPYPFFAPSDIQVYLVQTSTGISYATPTLNGSNPTDYTISGTLDATSGEYLSGCMVVPNSASAWGAGYTLTLTRMVADTQETSLSNNSLFPAKAIEAALDRLTMLTQQLATMLGQAVIAPPTDGPVSMVLPPRQSRLGQLAGFDAALGNIVGLTPFTGLVANPIIANINTFFHVDNNAVNGYTDAPVALGKPLPAINQGIVAAFTAGPLGRSQVVNVFLLLPMPNTISTFNIDVQLNAYQTAIDGYAAAWPSGWFYTTDYKGKFTITFWGATPGSAVNVMINARGF